MQSRNKTQACQQVLRIIAALLLIVSPAVAAAPPSALQSSHSVTPNASAAAAPKQLADDWDELVAPDSPRASVQAYLRLCRAGEYELAARYLNVPLQKAKRAPELARRLQAVIEHRVQIDLDSISPLSEGAVGAKTPRYEEIGRIRGTDGTVESLRLVQKDYPGPDARWVFSQSVATRIDDWYAELDGRWLLDHLPRYLQRRGPYNIMLWQWLALPLLFLADWCIAYLFSRASRKLLAFVTTRTRPTWDDEIVTQIDGPLVLIWMLLLGSVALPWLALPVAAEHFGQSLIKGGFLFSLFWFLSRLVDAWGKRLIVSQWARGRAVSSSLITLGVRVGKIAVLVVAVVALVSAMGYPAASLLAGLGVGGLAVALAAQKTLEHLFGAFAIGADRPFNEGDFIKVEDILGTVEVIGLRSTRIRTLDRTVVTIPNGKLSEMRVESFAARDKLLLSCRICLVYETSADQMHEVIKGFEHILNSHSKVEPGATVRFTGFGTSGLTVEVLAWFLTTDWGEFQLIRQETYLQFMQCVSTAGTAIALPAQRIHLQAQSPS